MPHPDPQSHPGTLHYIPPSLCAFEPSKPLVRSLDINTLIWVGGLFDTLGSVGYPFPLAQALGPKWSLLAASLGSAGMGWGVSSISKDADEIAQIVAYVRERRPGGKVVIMGHSTGCQDCMEYLVGKSTGEKGRPAVDGVVLQAPVSDREALEMLLPEAIKHEADQLALEMCRKGKDKDAIPNRLSKHAFGHIAITARRWVDISSPGPDHAGADDFFSSDHSDERLKGSFGKIPASTPLLVLFGGKDEAVPESVDREKMVQRWFGIVKQAGGSLDDVNGGIVPGASHNLNGDPDKVVQDLINRVVGYIGKLDGGEFATAGGDSKS